MNRSSFQVIDGGKVSRKPPARVDFDNAANRFLYYGAELGTLAWKLGCKQADIAHRAVEIATERARLAGIREGRGLLRPPTAPAAARRAA